MTRPNMIAPDHWAVYKCVLDKLCTAGYPFALGGGQAVTAYTGRPRPSKDLDIYVLPEHRESLIAMMSQCGLADYYEEAPYDRQWIYRGHSGDVIVDAIWAMANRRAQVDLDWLTRGPEIDLYGQRFRVVPPEELIWSKLYVLQRDRCDWPDILNLIYATGSRLDWDRLLTRVGEDRPLVKGVLSVFAWLSPGEAGKIPRPVWEALQLPAPDQEEQGDERFSRRKDLLDSRPWLHTEPEWSAA